MERRGSKPVLLLSEPPILEDPGPTPVKTFYLCYWIYQVYHQIDQEEGSELWTR